MSKGSKLFITLMVALLLILGVVAKILFTKPAIHLTKPESYFSDFEVVGQQVNIKCYVTLKNTFNENKTVELAALFPDDVRFGLLQSSTLSGVHLDSLEGRFAVPAKSQKAFEVLFIGNFAGTNRKHDRLLPEIEIVIVS